MNNTLGSFFVCLLFLFPIYIYTKETDFAVGVLMFVCLMRNTIGRFILEEIDFAVGMLLFEFSY